MQHQFWSRRQALASTVAIALLSAASASAIAAEDAAGVLRRAVMASGADSLKSLRYTVAGTGYTFGQSYIAGKAWPKINIEEQTRVINYDTGVMREDIAYNRGEPTGGGGYPASGTVRSTVFVSSDVAWNLSGTTAAPNARARYGRYHQLWTTPHGVLRAAQRNNARLDWKSVDGQVVALVSFTEPGKFKAVATINQDYLVVKVESHFPDAVMGDTRTVTTYADYRDQGGVKFPARIQQAVGGHPVLDVTVRSVQANAAADMSVPDAARVPEVERVTTDKVADGLWFVAGGSHNSVAIEMKDHMILVESPLSDARANAVIDAVNKLVPGKTLRSVINSHQHFDHAGGVRAAIAAGLTIITHKDNAAFYREALKSSNSIVPDALAKSGKKARFVSVDDKHVISDGSRTIELYRITGNAHNESLLMAWLPKEKVLIEADAYTPGAAGAPPPTNVNPSHVNLVDNIARRKLDVARILPLHGRMVAASELYAAAKKTPTP